MTNGKLRYDFGKKIETSKEMMIWDWCLCDRNGVERSIYLQQRKEENVSL